MQAGELVGSDVQAFSSRVLVNGVQRPVLSWNVQRELVGDLPEQVVSGGGITQATGTISWAGERDVNSGVLNPWNPSTGWIPTPGDRVQIFAGDGVTEWSQFVGRIDSPVGSIGDGHSTTIVDRFDDLSRTIDLPAILADMPPIQDGGNFRHVGVTSLFHASAALRAAGFHCVPPREFGAVLDATFQGSCWPLLGTNTSCERISNTLLAPVDYAAPWGRCFGDVRANYQPSEARSATVPAQLTLMTAPTHTGTAYLVCSYGDKKIELRASNATRSIRVNGVVMGQVSAPGSTITQVLFKNGQATLKTNTGHTVSAAYTLGTTAAMSNILVYGDADSRIAGIQVSHPSESAEFASVGFVSSAVFDAGSMHRSASAVPAFPDVPASEVIEAYSKALLRPFWIDETGVARSVASDRLRAQGVAQTLTTADDVRELSWRSDLLGVRSEVKANYLYPTINVRRFPALTVWEQSSAEVLGDGESLEVFIEPPSGEDWVMVEEGLTIPGLNAVDEMNKGRGTIAGGVYTNGVDEQWAPQIDKLTVTRTKLAANKWVLRFAAKNIAAGYQVELRTWSSTFAGNTGLWPYWWGKNLPIVRSRGKVEWAELTRTPTIAGTRGPVLEHDFGAWCSSIYDTDQIDMITSFIAEQVTTPQPVITSMRVGFDPRRQLGDVVTVTSPQFMGVTLKCLITGVETDASDSYSQQLSVRVIDVQTTFVTYAEFAEAWGRTSDYATFATAWDAVSTYSDFNENPLRGTN